MSLLQPHLLFARIARDIPVDLHQHLFVTGSLAVAYHFQARLEGRAVNTKDADIVVHPAGNVASTQSLAMKLRQAGWRPTEQCHPMPAPQPPDNLRAIRLYPPDGNQYFIEFLNLPSGIQREPKRWLPVQLHDGWYGLPSFRFLGLTAIGQIQSKEGLNYASPAMMALSNLLAHPIIGTERMASGGLTHGLLRSAKDLGRVLAIAWLSEREQVENWLPLWNQGLRKCFPKEFKTLAAQTGAGLRELLIDEGALEEARKTTEIGLLGGKNVTAAMLRATGLRLMADVIDPLAEQLHK